MERAEISIAAVLVLASLVLGLAVFSIFFKPLTAEVRPPFRNGLRRLARWLSSNARRILLVAALAAAGLVVLYLGFRFGGETYSRLREMVQGQGMKDR